MIAKYITWKIEKVEISTTHSIYMYCMTWKICVVTFTSIFFWAWKKSTNLLGESLYLWLNLLSMALIDSPLLWTESSFRRFLLRPPFEKQEPNRTYYVGNNGDCRIFQPQPWYHFLIPLFLSRRHKNQR